MKLSGRKALVTGGAHGIGLAIAQAFARDGADVALLDIDGAAAEAAARALAVETGRKAVGLACDVSDADAALAAVTKAAEAIGPIDLLVNNAGIVAAGDILTASLEDFDRVMAINIRGAFVIGQAVALGMVAAGLKGSIVNISSINAVVAIPTQLAYVTSKGAMNQLTRAMALGLAPHGIRVNAIGPGTIETEILKGVMTSPDAARGVLARTPLKRIGQPEEIAKVAVFLASEDASYFTGQTLYPDGGRLALNYTVAVD
jgi:glucose 1-dehydrogenase